MMAERAYNLWTLEVWDEASWLMQGFNSIVLICSARDGDGAFLCFPLNRVIICLNCSATKEKWALASGTTSRNIYMYFNCLLIYQLATFLWYYSRAVYLYLMRTVFLSVISTACSWLNSSTDSWWLWLTIELLETIFSEAAELTAPLTPWLWVPVELSAAPETLLTIPALMLKRDRPSTMLDKRLSSPSISFLQSHSHSKMS